MYIRFITPIIFYFFVLALFYFSYSLIGYAQQEPVVFPGDGAGAGPILKYHNNEDGTFTDLNTKFMWEYKDEEGGLNDINNQYSWSKGGSTEPDGTLYTDFLDKMKNSCNGNVNITCTKDTDCPEGKCGHAGYRDWCIPNIKQLHSIVNYGENAPASSLPDVKVSKFFWSSTEMKKSPSNTWVVISGIGAVSNVPKTTTLNMSARAIRPCGTYCNAVSINNGEVEGCSHLQTCAVTCNEGFQQHGDDPICLDGLFSHEPFCENTLEIPTLDFRIGKNGGSGLPGSESGEFNRPYDIALDDSSKIFVSDLENNRIQIFNNDGSYISQLNIVGDGTINLHRPKGIAIDSINNLYIADSLHHRIVKCDTTGVCNVFAGTGVPGFDDGPNPSFNSPAGITIDGSNNIYIADSGNHTIRKCNTSGVCVTVAGNPGMGNHFDGVGSIARFDNPRGITMLDNGTFLIADVGNDAIRKLNPETNEVTTFLGTGSQRQSNGDGLNALLSQPSRVTSDEDGRIYVSDTNNSRIAIYRPDATFITEFGNNELGGLLKPKGIVHTRDKLYIVDRDLHRVQVFNLE